MTNFIATIMLFSVSMLLSCTKKTKTDEHSDSVETYKLESILGVYEGVIPCADCSGINQKMTIKPDGTFITEWIYLGKGDEKPISETGKFKISKDTIIFTLPNAPNKYIISKGFIEQLDINGNKIESKLNYKLLKK